MGSCILLELSNFGKVSIAELFSLRFFALYNVAFFDVICIWCSCWSPNDKFGVYANIFILDFKLREVPFGEKSIKFLGIGRTSY